MYEALYESQLADQQRQFAWVNTHAWKFEQTARQSLRGRIANAFRAVAERIAPVTETRETTTAVQR